jgi:hypothetical protein
LVNLKHLCGLFTDAANMIQRRSDVTGDHIRRHTINLCYLDDWLTVHRSITLFDLQLDAQNSYLFRYNTFIKILYVYRALPCSSSGLRRNCIYAASGMTIQEAAYIQLRRRPPEDEQGNARNM